MEIQPVDPEFVRVWSRVKAPAGAPSSASPPEQCGDEWEEFLAGKLRAEAQRLRDYHALGLNLPARECAARIKKLSAARFFRSGQSRPPQGRGRPNHYSGRGEAIRQLYQGERLSEQDYRKAAEACQEEDLKAAFTFCAHSCQSARRALWQTVENS